MRRYQTVGDVLAASAAALLGLFLLPLLLVRPQGAAAADPSAAPEEPPPSPLLSAPAAESAGIAETPPIPDAQRTLRVLQDQTVREMTLEEYLLGVTAAEMPASFHQEALKAQAVAARTYTLYKMRTGGSHGDTADICTDSVCCQAYIDPQAARANWSGQAAAYEAKIRAAVSGTDGQVILYGGVPILAVFHASSAGLTRPASAVWQSDLPYLLAVDSPEEGAQIPNYYSRTDLTAAQVRQALTAAFPDAVLAEKTDTWLQDPVRDGAGSVQTLEVGGVTVRGSALRSALGLRSACFTWETAGDAFTFFVTGHGHGVGLSQYGANAMAQAGSDYKEILTHYYSGVTVAPYGG